MTLKLTKNYKKAPVFINIIQYNVNFVANIGLKTLINIIT